MNNATEGYVNSSIAEPPICDNETYSRWDNNEPSYVSPVQDSGDVCEIVNKKIVYLNQLL